MAEPLVTETPRPVGIRDIPLVLFAPGRLFARVENVAVYGLPLIVLLTLVTLVGYATLETGLIDREVDREVNAEIARIDAEQRDVVERSALRDLYEDTRKTGEFKKLLTRMRVVVAEPVKALVSALLIASVLYGAVALTGKKPEWNTLLTICVYAGFIGLLRLGMILLLMLRYRTLEIDTSLAILTRIIGDPGQTSAEMLVVWQGLLSAIEPFRIWFWLVIISGLSATAQLRGWRAWVTCSLCWLIATGGRTALAAAVANATAASASP